MSHNIQTVDDIATHATATVQTVSRPILIRFEHAAAGGGAPTATAVQAEVSVEVDGVWTKVGGALIASKEWDSSTSDPKFYFDVAPLLASRIEGGDYQGSFGIGMGAMASSLNTVSQSRKLMIKYKVEARALYVAETTGILTLNETDAVITSPSSGNRYAVNFFVPDHLVTTSKYTNLNVMSGWNISNAVDTQWSGQGERIFKCLTNCPSSLRRKIPILQPMALQGFVNGYTADDIELAADYIKDDGVAVTNHIVSSTFMLDTTHDINIKTITPSETYLMSELTGASTASCGANFSLFTYASSLGGVKLNFELMNSKLTSNPNLRRIKPSDTSIYFLNDFGVWDFFIFDGFLDITHTHEKTTFKKGTKDYTLRESSRMGVARSTTTEIYTCHALVNRETSEWLSEIFRSKKVYYYNENEPYPSSYFVPVTVIDGETNPSSSNKLTLEPFSLSFIKDTHTVKG